MVGEDFYRLSKVGETEYVCEEQHSYYYFKTLQEHESIF